MKFTIVYQSKRGTTAAYARAIAMYLWQKGMNVSLCATSDFDAKKLEGCDCLMLGCWTSGWFVVNQHPNSIWSDFADEKLQGELPPKVVLFTTYKIHTGSMFKRMWCRLNHEGVELVGTMKSKTGMLTDKDRQAIDQMIINIKP